MTALLAALILAAADPNEAPLPPLSDLQRFPRRPAVKDARAFNVEWRSNFRTWGVYWHGWERYEVACEESWRLYRIWDRLDDAQIYDSVERRREALADLKEMLGEEAYSAGFMPFPVPLWACRVMD